MDMSTVVQTGLLYGSILSAAMTVFVVGSLRLNNEMWLDDYPPDVRAAWGPMSAQARRLKRWAGLIFMALVVGLIALHVRHLVVLAGGFDFWGVALSLWVSLMLFNLVDLVLIDWLILMVLRPSFAMLPGTEGLKGYTDYMFPFVGFLKGTVGITLAAPVLAAVAYGVYGLVR
jgi:hypothetical protein